MTPNNENYLPDFLTIPCVLIQDKRLQNLDRLVYGVIYWYSKLKLEKCIVSNSQMGKLLGATRDSVSNAVSRLDKYGYVRVLFDENVPGKNKVRKEIIPLIVFTDLPSENGRGSHQKMAGVPSSDGRGVPSNDGHNNNIYNNNIKKDNTSGEVKTNFIEGSLNEEPVPYSKELSDIEEAYAQFVAISGQAPLLTPVRRAKIKTRLKTFTLEQIIQAITNCYGNAFYSGSKTGWKADIDYVFRSDEIMDKLLNLAETRRRGGTYVQQ